jgi:hypothetical protein
MFGICVMIDQKRLPTLKSNLKISGLSACVNVTDDLPILEGLFKWDAKYYGFSFTLSMLGHIRLIYL